MAAALVSGQTNNYLDDGSSSTIVLAFPGDVTADSLLVAAVYSNTSSDPTSVSDTRSNTWYRIASAAMSGPLRVSLWYTYGTTGGPCTVTANLAGSEPYRRMVIAEFSGVLPTSDPYDPPPGNVSSYFSTGTDSITTGAIAAPSQDGALWVCIAGTEGSVAQLSPGTLYTFADGIDSGSNYHVDMEYYVQPTAASIAGTWDCATEGGYGVIAAAFLPGEGEPEVPLEVGTYKNTTVSMNWTPGAPPSGTEVDMYFDWRGGSNNDAVTTAIAAAGCYPATPTYSPTAYPTSPLPILIISTGAAAGAGTVTVGGTEYDLANCTQGLRMGHATTDSDEVRVDITSESAAVVSVGFAFKTTLNADLYEQYGQSGIQGIADAEWAILSTYIDASANVHACIETNGNLWPATPTNGPTLAADTWYWITIQYNATAEEAYLRAYLMSTWEQVGSEVVATLVSSPPDVWCVDMGLVASEGNTDSGAYSYYGPWIIDYTDGTYPLLPVVE